MLLSLLLLITLVTAQSGTQVLGADEYLKFDWDMESPLDVVYTISSNNGNLDTYIMNSDQLSKFTNGDKFEYYTSVSKEDMSVAKVDVDNVAFTSESFTLVIKSKNLLESTTISYDIDISEHITPADTFPYVILAVLLSVGCCCGVIICVLICICICMCNKKETRHIIVDGRDPNTGPVRVYAPLA